MESLMNPTFRAGTWHNSTTQTLCLGPFLTSELWRAVNDREACRYYYKVLASSVFMFAMVTYDSQDSRVLDRGQRSVTAKAKPPLLNCLLCYVACYYITITPSWLLYTSISKSDELLFGFYQAISYSLLCAFFHLLFYSNHFCCRG